MLVLLTLIFSYFLGAIPSGFLAGKYLANIDLREKGSGSTGATNVFREVGKWPALLVFLCDVFKGVSAVLLAKVFNLEDNWQVLAGLLAIIGHIWPIWLGWKGGKAVATGLGILLGISWPVGLTCLGVFLTVFSFSKIVSLASVTAAISLPVLMAISFKSGDFRYAYFLFSIITMAIVLWRHRSNLQRLKDGTEPKVSSVN